MDLVSYSIAAKALKGLSSKADVSGNSLVVPKGTTATRPTLSAEDTALRYNTDLPGLEEWNGVEWRNVSAAISAVNLKGTDTAANILAMSGMVAEDLWIASDTLDGYVYDGSVWINIGPLQGPQGVVGATGPQGIQGEVGPQGIQGIQGETGLQGIQGVKGDTGDSVNHVTRTTGTGAAGTVDVYTLWGDVGETIDMGSFNVYNGANGTGTLQSVVAGSNITVDNTDPNNPVINSTADLSTVYTKTEVQTVLPKVGFDTTNVVVPSVGQMAWNTDEGTLDLGLGDAVLQVGQEFIVKVRNASGGVIANGTVVMASGSIGNSGRITVVPHDGTQANAARAIGVLTQTLADGVDGFATVIGKVRDIDATGSSVSETWVDGDVLYIKPNDNGNLTKIAPIDTEISMKVAMVVKAHVAGTLYIRVVGFDENHYKAWVQTRLDAKVTRPVSTTHKIVKFTDTDGSIGDSNLVSNSMGDLGLNVSPSLWHTSVRALETAAGALFHYGSTKISWIQNAYQGLDGVFRYKSNAPATIITQDSGDIVFSTAPSGTTEGSVTFTEKMKLSNTGVLTVGGTEVQSKLDSGANIKTINGTSVLGSGDIVIELDTADLQTEINNFQVGAGLRLDGLYSQSSVVVSNIHEHVVPNQYINATPYNTKTLVCTLTLNFIETPLIEYNAVRDKQTGEIFKFEDGFVNLGNMIESVIFDISIIKNQDYYVHLNFDPYIDLLYTPLDLNVRYVELVKVHYIIDEFNYINGAISLYDADKKLDTQLKLLSDSKQDTLVSGENIKTVNGTSILGSGNIDISAGAVLDKHVFVATAGQTEFTVAYTVGLLEVYRNGLKLTSDLYIATNGTSVTLVDACVVDDVVEVIGYSSFDVMDTYTITQTDALIATKQDVLISGVGIKTVNGESVLGSGDISVQPTLVSGTSIKTVNGSTLLGTGDIPLESGGLKSVQTFTSSGTWTKPTSINFIKVIAVGGGGGGCLGIDGAYGGAAGATIIRYVDVTAISSATITIGAGGAGGAGGATAGGSTTISGGISLTANGASGSSGAQRRPAGGLPSVETLPNLSMPGGAGGASELSLDESGCGGDSFLSPGGVGACANTPRSATSGNYGSGGGGGYNATYKSGSGGNGIVIIEEYIR